MSGRISPGSFELHLRYIACGSGWVQKQGGERGREGEEGEDRVGLGNLYTPEVGQSLDYKIIGLVLGGGLGLGSGNLHPPPNASRGVIVLTLLLRSSRGGIVRIKDACHPSRRAADTYTKHVL